MQEKNKLSINNVYYSFGEKLKLGPDFALYQFQR